MALGKIEYLYDSGQTFSESWSLPDHQPEIIGKSLMRIAAARQSLLAKNIRVVRVRAKGFTQVVEMRGYGGNYAHPRDGWKLQNGGYSTALRIRGMPRELIRGSGLWPQLQGNCSQYLDTLCKVLKECGCTLGKRKEPISSFVVWRHTLYNWRKDKVITKIKLKKLMGAEKGEMEWEEMKKRRKEKEKI